MYDGLKKRYILAALVCFGAVMFGGGFVQAESTTAESRSETRTTVDRNGTIAERVRRTESRTTVSSETKDSDAIRNMAAEQRRMSSWRRLWYLTETFPSRLGHGQE